ncbi:LuxR C-terminal-related transcriptional regulator [Streptomyces flavalbus]|uniref:LuxR C-terminal-related transcriptional regulator n=1 Tax=Streptomyces flavalbus TaxID=2665155 RepID=A0ABW2WJZ9_9ACTN
MSEQALHHHDVTSAPRDHRTAPHTLDVAVYHEDAVIRCGLMTLLHSVSEVGSVYALDERDLVRDVLTRRQPDIVVLPAAFEAGPLQEVLELTRGAGVKVLLTLPTAARECVRRAGRLNVDGFLLESGLTEESLTHAVRAVACGEMPVPPSLVRELMSEATSGGRRDRGPQLTPREEAALTLLVHGMSNKQIAHRLGISENGAKRHVSNVLAKLNCPNRTVAAVIAVKDGLIPAPAPSAAVL